MLKGMVSFTHFLFLGFIFQLFLLERSINWPVTKFIQIMQSNLEAQGINLTNFTKVITEAGLDFKMLNT